MASSTASKNNNANPPMSSTIDKHFTRLSFALETLIKSLATYNPNPALANDLAVADAELNLGLEELHTHQTNHTRILALRAQSTHLDTQIKDTLTLLTTARAEIIATPGTKLPEETSIHAVSYSELLSYARRISRTTLPGTYREPEVQTQVQSQETQTNTAGLNTGSNNEGGTGATGANTNGNSTPVVIPTSNGVEKSEGEHSTALPPQFQAATTLPTNVFTPWPHDMMLRRGALATIQNMMENGDGGLSGEGWRGLEGVDEEKGVESESGNLWLAGEKEEVGRVDALVHGGGQQQQQRVVKKKAAFELETFEDDDDDDED